MTDTPTPHRATPEQWRQLRVLDQRYVTNVDLRDLIVFRGIILELADRLATAEQRISELESAEPQITPEEAEMIAAPWSLITPEPQPAAPAGSLVEVVEQALEDHHVVRPIYGCWDAQARAAILAVSAWIEERHHSDPLVHTAWETARWLREEVERG